MHATCDSNGNGRRHVPANSTTNDHLGTAFAEPAEAAENSGGGRDAKGRFAPGNAGGPGNPFARRTAELRREFLAEATGEDLRSICRALLERAKAGDVAAAKLAMSYLVGKPDKPVDPDTLDEQEWHIWRRYTASSEWVELIQCLPLDVILNLVRSVWPVLTREKCAQGQALFATPGPVPQEPECETAGEKRRARRRGGKRRRPGGEKSSAGMADAMATMPTEEPRPQEAGPLGGADVAGAAAEDMLPRDVRAVPASACGAVERPAGEPSHGRGEVTEVGAGFGTLADEGVGGERPGPAPEGQAGNPPRAESPGEPLRPEEGDEAPPVARGGVVGEGKEGEAVCGRRWPSANGGNGAGAAVTKPCHMGSR
jgi:hypothetical protein